MHALTALSSGDANLVGGARRAGERAVLRADAGAGPGRQGLVDLARGAAPQARAEPRARQRALAFLLNELLYLINTE